jgi:hypothetical protein
MQAPAAAQRGPLAWVWIAAFEGRAGPAGGGRGFLARPLRSGLCPRALARLGAKIRGTLLSGAGVSSLERLGPVGCMRYRTFTSGLSTWWSSTALMARPGFEVGFPLRCLQRLSRPYLATRLCRWRDNRSTRGTSTPVLSY